MEKIVTLAKRVPCPLSRRIENEINEGYVQDFFDSGFSISVIEYE